MDSLNLLFFLSILSWCVFFQFLFLFYLCCSPLSFHLPRINHLFRGRELRTLSPLLQILDNSHLQLSSYTAFQLLLFSPFFRIRSFISYITSRLHSGVCSGRLCCAAGTYLLQQQLFKRLPKPPFPHCNPHSESCAARIRKNHSLDLHSSILFVNIPDADRPSPSVLFA